MKVWLPVLIIIGMVAFSLGCINNIQYDQTSSSNTSSMQTASTALPSPTISVPSGLSSTVSSIISTVSHVICNQSPRTITIVIPQETIYYTTFSNGTPVPTSKVITSTTITKVIKPVCSESTKTEKGTPSP